MRSFRTRLILLLLALVGAIQFPTFVAVYFATRGNALDQADQRLDVGARVFQRLLASREAQLRDAVRVIAADFGFREAVATGDEATVQSVLFNHGARINAGFAVTLDLKGQITTSTVDLHAMPGQSPFSSLFARADREGVVSTVDRSGAEPYQIVLAPVRAPQRIGWVGMGFGMDQALAAEFKALTGLEVTFATTDTANRVHLYSTLAESVQEALATAFDPAAPASARSMSMSLLGEDYLTHVIPLGDSTGIEAILQTREAEVLKPYAILNRQLLAISTLSFLASLVGAWLLARGVTRPVQELAVAANRVERGDYLGSLASHRADEFGQLARAFDGMQRGIAERERRISHLAYHDALTGLPNRISIDRLLSQLLAGPSASRAPFAVLMVDVNRFKEINDTLGHPIGDRLLVSIGQRMRAMVRTEDVVARLGGDEFLVVLPGADESLAAELAATLVAAVTEPVQLDSMKLYPEISLGIVLYPGHADTAEDLLRRADIAMYDAKQAQAAVSFYSSGRDALHLRRLSLINDLRRATENDQLSVYYQPKMSLDDECITHVEALVRWQHPVEGAISPEEFIPLAEHAGSIRQITRWMLRTVIRQCRTWHDQGHRVGVSINISAMDLAAGDLPSTVRALLDEFGIDAASVVLEVTESAVMRDSAIALDMLGRLKECGVRLAIDDFGTGYSSLSHLKRMPVDELKIDKSFVMGMADDSDDATIVRATIELGHSMGLSVVAEGVENSRSLRMLEDYRCDMAQGYLISRPVPAAELTALLVAHNGMLAARSKSKVTP
ncbi:MAG: EAL domain-containing protein [Xanthomonadales bacterium]|nr:EAL domain-containing protein [Xanthomonadales bacterium]